MAMQQQKLPPLPYDFSALQPVISAKIMELHYTKHHQGYVNNLNAALEKYADAEAKNDLAALISLQSAINFNGGGHLNHSLFWENLAPKGQGGEPQGALAKAITSQWPSLDAFIEDFNAKTAAIQGSGWGWLTYNKATKRLEYATCANQDPVTSKGLVPLLGIDVWEHAYYLQYENRRPDYLKAIWEVINWKTVEERYNKATAAK